MPNWGLHLVDNLDELAPCYRWVCDRANKGLPIAIDTETKGLDWWQPNYLRLIQFGSDTEAYIVPTELWHGLARECMRVVRDSHTEVHGWNLNFDVQILRHNHLPVPHPNTWHDGMLAHSLLYPQEAHGLKGVATTLVGPFAKTGQSWLYGEASRLGLNRSEMWEHIPYDNLAYWGYAGIDTILNYHVNEILIPQVLDQYEEAYVREMEYLAVIVDAEARGLRIDMEYCEALASQWREELYHLSLALKSEHGIANPSSNPQIEVAFIASGWEPTVFTKTGQAQLDRKVMNQLLAHPRLAPAAELIMRYRRVSKWLSTYIERFLRSGGTVYPTVRTMEAKTGRSSITNPPLQTLPGKASGSNEIRRGILSRRDGELLV